MSKPGTIYTFDSGKVHVVTTTSGHQTSGFANNEIPGSGEINYILSAHADWLAYLDGNNYVGGITIDALTVTSTVQATTGYEGAAGAKALFPSGLSSVTRPAYTTAVTWTIPTLDSTDHPSGAPGATHTRSPGKWTFAASTTPIYFPINVETGDTITAYTMDLTKNDTFNAVFSQLITSDATGDHAISTGATSGITSGSFAQGESGLSFTSSGAQYFIKVTPGGTSSPSGDVIANLRVSTIRP